MTYAQLTLPRSRPGYTPMVKTNEQTSFYSSSGGRAGRAGQRQARENASFSGEAGSEEGVALLGRAGVGVAVGRAGQCRVMQLPVKDSGEKSGLGNSARESKV